MPPKNPTIGHIDCPMCTNKDAEVRMSDKAKFYFYCKGCGLVQPSLDGGQHFIKTNARPVPGKESYFNNVEVKILTSIPEPAPAPVPEPAPEPKPEPKPAPKLGFLDRPLF